MTESTSPRKLEHIELVLRNKVESTESTLLEHVRIVHNPLPEVNLEKVETAVPFCGGKRIKAPLMITGMTGGHKDVAWINEKIAAVAEELGIAMGVGSQRAAIERPELSYTFSVARKAAPSIPIVANIGAPQLAKGYGVAEIERAIEMVEADAVAIHLNAGQEAFQDEGDTDFTGIIERVAYLADRIGVPIIAKEVGNGLSREAIAALYSIGIKCFDVAGLGGTSWIKVEVMRSKSKHGEPLKPAGPMADFWGNPTAVAVVEARIVAPEAFIIASGGIRNGLDASRAIAIGANVAGLALPTLRSLHSEGERGLRRLLESIIYQIKVSTFLAGEGHVWGLWRAPIAVSGRLREELEARGVDIIEYIRMHRLLPLMRGARLGRDRAATL